VAQYRIEDSGETMTWSGCKTVRIYNVHRRSPDAIPVVGWRKVGTAWSSPYHRGEWSVKITGLEGLGGGYQHFRANKGNLPYVLARAEDNGMLILTREAFKAKRVARLQRAVNNERQSLHYAQRQLREALAI
tara:strand:+ start:141 stop:536 length:396 start_codon:yes stop_codon:yes gene_type:complete